MLWRLDILKMPLYWKPISFCGLFAIITENNETAVKTFLFSNQLAKQSAISHCKRFPLLVWYWTLLSLEHFTLSNTWIIDHLAFSCCFVKVWHNLQLNQWWNVIMQWSFSRLSYSLARIGLIWGILSLMILTLYSCISLHLFQTFQ